MTKKHQFKTLNINYKRKLYKAQHTHTHVIRSCVAMTASFVASGARAQIANS